MLKFLCRANLFVLSILVTAAVSSTGCGQSEVREDKASPATVGPVSPEAVAYLIRAQEALEGADFSSAFAFADSAEQAADRSETSILADVAFLRGRIYSDINQIEKSRTAYEKVLQHDPAYRGAWFNLGNLAFRQERYGDAIAAYRRERAYADDTDPKILINIGRAFIEIGELDSARIAFEQVIEVDSTLAEPYIRLAFIYDQEGKTERAVELYEKAHRLEPSNQRYLYLYGSELLESGKLEEAVEHLEEAVEQNPGDYSSHYNLGQAFARLGKTGEARYHLAVSDSLRQLEVDLGEWRRLTRINPESPAIWATYGVALRIAGRDEEALEALKVALHLDPKNPDIRFEIANLYLQYGELDAALAHYQLILEQDSSYVGAWVNSGIAHARAERTEAAREAWENALHFDPDHADARAYLSSLANIR